MSIRIQSEVWERSRQKGGALLVLLALADNANNETHLAWPSVRDLARRSRMSERQVQNILRKLQADREIRCIEPGGMYGTRRRATVYRVFHPEDRGEKTAPLPTGGEAGNTGRGEISAPEGVNPTSPQPSIEPSSKPSGEKLSREQKRRRDGYEWLFEES